MLCGIFLIAQPTLQYPNNAPEIGDVVQIQFVANDGLTVGPIGPDVTWDYSGLTATFGGEITVIDPAQAPAGGDYPDANVVMNMGDTIFTYAKTDADGYFYEGSQFTTGTFPTQLIYSNSRTFIKFPFTYLDTYNDTYKGVVTTSVATIHVEAETEMLSDSYGTLILPTGTYNNVLRTTTIDIEIDSVFVGGFYTKSFELIRTQYSWFQANSKGPLMSIEIMTNPLAMTLDTVAYFMTSGAGIGDLGNQPVSLLSVYPNPAEDHLMVEYEVAGNISSTIAIVNQVGQLMYDRLVNSDGTGLVREKVDISTMPSGMYFVNVSCNCGKQITQKFVIR
jgi:hypothetical protein